MNHKPREFSPEPHRPPFLADSDGPHSGEGAASALANLKRRRERLNLGPRRPVAPRGDRLA